VPRLHFSRPTFFSNATKRGSERTGSKARLTSASKKNPPMHPCDGQPKSSPSHGIVFDSARQFSALRSDHPQRRDNHNVENRLMDDSCASISDLVRVAASRRLVAAVSALSRAAQAQNVVSINRVVEISRSRACVHEQSPPGVVIAEFDLTNRPAVFISKRQSSPTNVKRPSFTNPCPKCNRMPQSGVEKRPKA
jgi:hypothetical protein